MSVSSRVSGLRLLTIPLGKASRSYNRATGLHVLIDQPVYCIINMSVDTDELDCIEPFRKLLLRAACDFRSSTQLTAEDLSRD